MVSPSEKSMMARLLGVGTMRLSPDVAREVLSWQFTDEDRSRVQDLLDLNSAGTLTPEDRRELDRYEAAEDMLAVLHARASLVLSEATPVKTT